MRIDFFDKNDNSYINLNNIKLEYFDISEYEFNISLNNLQK